MEEEEEAILFDLPFLTPSVASRISISLRCFFLWLNVLKPFLCATRLVASSRSFFLFSGSWLLQAFFLYRIQRCCHPFLFLWDEGFWVGNCAILSPLSVETGTSILIACLFSFFLSFFLSWEEAAAEKEGR